MKRADYALGCAILGSAVAAAPLGRSPAAPFVLPSEIPGVTDESWTRFADEARRVAGGVARDPRLMDGDGFGMFAIRVRRLADLGMVDEPRQVRDTGTGRMVWIADFVPPFTAGRFRADLGFQYRTFADSSRAYAKALREGALEVPPAAEAENMTLSGALAVLHRCGPLGLHTWASGKRFARTVDAYNRANGIF